MMVTVQVSVAAKSVSGLSVNVVGPPLTVAVCEPLALHEIPYHEPLGVTGSVNVISMLPERATSVAPAGGVVAETAGARSPLLRGSGAPTVKSATLLSVSVAPPAARLAEVVLV